MRHPALRYLLFAALCCASIVGCHAQVPAGAQALAPAEQRRISLMVRSQLSVPADWDMVLAQRTPSTVPGFDTLRIDFHPLADPAHVESAEFLLSKDGNTLARLNKYDLTKLPDVEIPTGGRPIRGDATAKVEIINFDDLECPYCARMHSELFPQTLDHYKGLIKVVYKDDPLMEIHPWALRAAVDANCLAAQNSVSYWRYVDYVHTHGDDISGPEHDVAKANTMLDKLAREEGARAAANKATLDTCLTRQDDSAVRASRKEADALNVDGTPVLFVDGERVSGAQPLPKVWAAIDRALRARGITPPPGEPAAAPAQGGTR